MYYLGIILLIASVAGQYDYNEILHKSILFYEAQRAGPLPEDNRIPWRGDSCEDDGADVGLDLRGGWFDAGDHVKFGFPLAGSITLLAWGMLKFEEGYRAADEWENGLDCIRWPLDYLMQAHFEKNAFIAQVAHGIWDHEFWGRPEEMTMPRPAWNISEDRPGTELACETAAALAASSMVFRDSDPDYADQLLSHSRDLYEFGYDFRGKYSDVINEDGDFYGSIEYYDELIWAAAWLYAATGEDYYRERAYENEFPDPGLALEWDNKWPGAHLVLYELTGEEVHVPILNAILENWFPGGGILYTPKGLAWLTLWGPNRHSANMVLFALVAAENGLLVEESREFAVKQIHYMLGDSGRSYVVGFGENPPHSVHHRAASCPDLPEVCDHDDLFKPEPNPQILYGALAGGPDENDDFDDDREDYVKNEVALDYNAGFQGAVAGLNTLRARGLL